MNSSVGWRNVEQALIASAATTFKKKSLATDSPTPIREEHAAQLQGVWSVDGLQLSAVSRSLVFQSDLGSPGLLPSWGSLIQQWGEVESKALTSLVWSGQWWHSCSVASQGRGGFAVSAFCFRPLHRCWTLIKYHTPQTPSTRLLLEDWTLSKARQIPLPIFIQSTRKGSFSPERLARPQSLVSSKIRQLVKLHSKLAGVTGHGLFQS